MPAKDDGVLYWLPTQVLVYANDSEAAKQPYWLAFRAAADELYRAYPHDIDLPADIESIWHTPRFAHMQHLYSAKWPKIPVSPQGAFGVIHRYQTMKILQRYVYEPIELLTKADGNSKNAGDCHLVQIDGDLWHYATLEGNHRLMAAFFAVLDRVPVLLKAKKTDATGTNAGTPVDGT